MDLCMVDVTDVPGAALGDEVVLLGRQGGQEVGVVELASWLDTMPYEVLCGVERESPRRSTRHGGCWRPGSALGWRRAMTDEVEKPPGRVSPLVAAVEWLGERVLAAVRAFVEILPWRPRLPGGWFGRRFDCRASSPSSTSWEWGRCSLSRSTRALHRMVFATQSWSAFERFGAE